MNDVHHIIANAWVYPRYKVIPELRRNGLKGTLPDCHPFELMKALLSDTRIETLMKAGNHKAVRYFLDNRSMLDKCWNSHKIAMRNGYRIEDYGLWCDLIKLLEKSGRDIRSVRYICPDNLRVSHDLWLNKVSTEEVKHRKAEEYRISRPHSKPCERQRPPLHQGKGNRIVQKCLPSGSLREARVGHFFRKIGKLIM